MRKKALIWLGLSPLIALLVLVALALLLGTTEGGTRWLAAQARGAAGESLAWRRVDGALLGDLRVRGLVFRGEGVVARVEDLQLRWRPAGLLSRALEVDRISADGIRVTLTDSPRDDTPSPPLRPSSLKPPLAIRIRELTLSNLEVAGVGDQPLVIERITVAGEVEDGRLTLRQLDVLSPDGVVSAGGGADLSDDLPLDLAVEVNWRLPDRSQAQGRLQAAGNLERYTITGAGQYAGAQLDPIQLTLEGESDTRSLTLDVLTVVSGPYQLALAGDVSWAGPITAALNYQASGRDLDQLQADLPPQLDAEGRLAATFENETLLLQQLTLALAQLPLTARVEGAVALPAGQAPRFEGNLAWSGAQWPLQGEADVSSPGGRLTLQGSPEAWTALVEAAVAGSQVPPGTWQGEASGTTENLRLHHLRGALLDGELALRGTAAWAPAPSWDLELTGRDLDPGQWLEALPGRLSLQATSSGRIDADTGPQAGFAVEQLHGTLAQQAFELSARGSLSGENLQLQSLQLSSGGNRLSASGQLAEQNLALTWDLQAPSPGALLAGAGGELVAEGRVTGSVAQPRMRASIRGRDLSLNDLALSQLDADLQAGLAADDPLQLDVALQALSQGEEALLSSARLRGEGSTARHQLDIEVDSEAARVHSRLTGGLDVETLAWTGELTELALDNPVAGHWRLEEPASLALAASSAALGAACLRAGDARASPDGRVCLGADWDQTEGAQFGARLEQLALKRWLPDLSGELGGEADFSLAPDGALAGEGSFILSQGQLRVDTPGGSRLLDHGGARLDLVAGENGLVAALGLTPLVGSKVEASVVLPGLGRLPPADTQPLAGRIRLDLPDLGGLQGWLPGVESLAGRLGGDLLLDGTLSQPRFTGELALAEAAADIPAAGLQLRQIQLRLRDDPDQPGLLRLSGGLTSGGGQLTVAGWVEPLQPALDLTLTGNRVRVYDTPDAMAEVSPDLRFGFSDGVARLRGQVRIPEARITPRLGIRPGTVAAEDMETAADTAGLPGQVIAPSPDVVVLGATEELQEVATPLRIDSDIELVLGKRVQVRALGFSGRIAGSLNFRNWPQQGSLIPTANGRLSVEGGTFRAFGQDLDIETGEIIYRQAPATEPEVNVRAVRWIDNDPMVSAAGVQISGPATTPTMELFSRPQLDDTEIQTYLLTGHSPASREAAVGIGTYLHPKFYVGYGYNLLEETSEFDALYTIYTITPRFGVEASVGEADNNLGVTITYEH